jgi:ribose 5-phosphate isomerase B
MRIAFGTDERTPLTDGVVARLREGGHQVEVVAGGDEWPEVGCCTTGTGVSIAANKVAGARAALCTDAATAAGARRWNDANVLALGLRLTSEAVAAEMLEAFLGAPADPGELPAVARVEGRG